MSCTWTGLVDAVDYAAATKNSANLTQGVEYIIHFDLFCVALKPNLFNVVDWRCVISSELQPKLITALVIFE